MFGRLGSTPLFVHLSMEQIQILSLLRFNLSPRPWRRGTAPSNLSLAIGLLPLTSPMVLSPSARNRCGHTWPLSLLPDCSSYKTIWNLGDLEQEIVSLSSLRLECISPVHWVHPETYLIWRAMWGQSRVSETCFQVFNLDSLLRHFYACLKFQRKGIDFVAVSELGTWTGCTWAIIKKGNLFQSKNSGSQIRSECLFSLCIIEVIIGVIPFSISLR